MKDSEMFNRLWFSGEIKEYAETVKYPMPAKDGEMYLYYYDGEKWVDIRFLDSQSVGGIKITYP